MSKQFKSLSDALVYQAGGNHYKSMVLQPAQMCEANFTEEEMEGAMKWNLNKYVWRHKNGREGRKQDMEKIIQYAQMHIGYLNSLEEE